MREGRRRALTLIEILVVLTVIGAVSLGMWTLFGAGLGSTRWIAGSMDAQQVIRVRFQELIGQVQSARRIFYPSPGTRTQSGLGFVDRSGKAIMVYLKEEGGDGVLYRADLNERTKEVVARHVAAFRVTIPANLLGEVPRTVNITLGMLASGSESESDADAAHFVKLATSVTIRALEDQYPE